MIVRALTVESMGVRRHNPRMVRFLFVALSVLVLVSATPLGLRPVRPRASRSPTIASEAFALRISPDATVDGQTIVWIVAPGVVTVERLTPDPMNEQTFVSTRVRFALDPQRWRAFRERCVDPLVRFTADDWDPGDVLMRTADGSGPQRYQLLVAEASTGCRELWYRDRDPMASASVREWARTCVDAAIESADRARSLAPEYTGRAVPGWNPPAFQVAIAESRFRDRQEGEAVRLKGVLRREFFGSGERFIVDSGAGSRESVEPTEAVPRQRLLSLVGMQIELNGLWDPGAWDRFPVGNDRRSVHPVPFFTGPRGAGTRIESVRAISAGARGQEAARNPPR